MGVHCYLLNYYLYFISYKYYFGSTTSLVKMKDTLKIK